MYLYLYRLVYIPRASEAGVLLQLSFLQYAKRRRGVNRSTNLAWDGPNPQSKNSKKSLHGTLGHTCWNQEAVSFFTSGSLWLLARSTSPKMASTNTQCFNLLNFAHSRKITGHSQVRQTWSCCLCERSPFCCLVRKAENKSTNKMRPFTALHPSPWQPKGLHGDAPVLSESAHLSGNDCQKWKPRSNIKTCPCNYFCHLHRGTRNSQVGKTHKKEPEEPERHLSAAAARVPRHQLLWLLDKPLLAPQAEVA